MLGFGSVASLPVASLAAIVGGEVVYVSPDIIRRMRVSLISPKVLRNTVYEGSTLFFRAEFFDWRSRGVTPEKIVWKYVNAQTEKVYSQGDLEPDDLVDFVVEPANATVRGRRALIVTANYNGGKQIVDGCIFKVIKP